MIARCAHKLFHSTSRAMPSALRGFISVFDLGTVVGSSFIQILGKKKPDQVWPDRAFLDINTDCTIYILNAKKPGLGLT